MKEVKAYIQPHKLDDVMAALHRIRRLSGVSVSTVEGYGRGRGRRSANGEEEQVEGFLTHARIETLCADDLVDEVCTAIEKAAHTGLRGDGKIYVGPIESAIRISTGERGDTAV